MRQTLDPERPVTAPIVRSARQRAMLGPRQNHPVCLCLPTATLRQEAAAPLRDTNLPIRCASLGFVVPTSHLALPGLDEHELATTTLSSKDRRSLPAIPDCCQAHFWVSTEKNGVQIMMTTNNGRCRPPYTRIRKPNTETAPTIGPARPSTTDRIARSARLLLAWLRSCRTILATNRMLATAWEHSARTMC